VEVSFPSLESNTLDNVINEANKTVKICEAVDCFVKATTTIEVEAGHHRTISLSLCNICVNKFLGDD
jgi:hypothetical protein